MDRSTNGIPVMMQGFRFALLALTLSIPLALAQAQVVPVTEGDYARAEATLGQHTSGLVYGATVRPFWLDGDRFWYLQELRGASAVIVVDPGEGTTESAVDLGRLAEAVRREEHC